ncbi:MAG: TRAP transporter small permease [Pikeienuella sp.]
MPASTEPAAPPAGPRGPVAIALDAVAVVATAAMLGLMIFLVAARYLLGLPVVGLHELIMLAAMALYMTGAVIASRVGEHLTVDWIAGYIRSPRLRALHEMLIAALTMVVTGFFILWAYRMFAWGIQRPQVTPAYQIPLWIPQSAIGLAAIACFGYGLRDMLGAFRRYRGA